MIPALSQDNLNLFRKLYVPRNWIQRFRVQDHRLDLLRQIEASGQIAAIPCLFHFLHGENEEFSHAAAGSMHRLFQGLAPQDFPAFDESMRRASWNSWNADAYTFVNPPKDIRALSRFGELSFFLVGILSCHADGYTREAAIRALAKCDTGEELPFVLLRVNDWVENVRQAAAEVLASRIKQEYIPQFVKFLPLVLRLKGTKRQDHGATLQRIQDLFSLSVALPSIETGMSSKEILTRRFCYGLALKTCGSDRLASVVRRALADRDVRISLDAVRAMSSAPSSSIVREIVDEALLGSIPAVRLAALRLVIKKYPESARAECLKGLLDRNFGVRQQAQFYFRKAGSLDVCDFYAAALSNATNKTLPVVITGIGECCGKTQIDLIKPRLTSKLSAVRVRVLRSIARLDPKYSLDDYLKALEDESSAVVREAALFIRKRVNSVGGEQIWNIHGQLKRPGHRRWTLFLLLGLMKWDCLYYLIQAQADQDASVAELARKYFGLWLKRYNRSFIPPSKAQIEKLKAALHEHELLFSSADHKQLVSLLSAV
ncbi:MAG TPA: hypothetical protein VN454_09570 [Candidatus Angelobacter sp.]|nr:hypothetical protein [Candidatus Angelobacter sp.]